MLCCNSSTVVLRINMASIYLFQRSSPNSSLRQFIFWTEHFLILVVSFPGFLCLQPSLFLYLLSIVPCFLLPLSLQGTIIRTRKTCKKISRYMREIVENDKIFPSYVEHFLNFATWKKLHDLDCFMQINLHESSDHASWPRQ